MENIKICSVVDSLPFLWYIGTVACSGKNYNLWAAFRPSKVDNDAVFEVNVDLYLPNSRSRVK